MEFVKAVLEQVTNDAADPPTRVPGTEPFEVQLNPATLRLQMASTVDFGKDAARSKVTYQGSTSTLSFDLVFDTADEGTSDAPVDVRSRTRHLERFVLPLRGQTKSVPPRLRFTYGTFSIVGVMTGLNQDFDFFAENGVPLRAKCAVTVKEQKPEFDAAKVGAGGNTGEAAVPPLPSASGAGARGGGAGVPGTGPPPPPADRTGTAVAGESAPDFAQRMGLDPRAWKGLQGLDDPVRLPPGLQVDFSSRLTATPGLGSVRPAPVASAATVPDAAGAHPATLPLDGPALAGAGGVSAVLDRAAAAAATEAANAARDGFVAGPDTPAAPAPDPAAGPPSVRGPVRADARALGYGFGVPLRPRVATTAPRGSSGSAAVPATRDVTVPRWRALRDVPGGPPATGCRPCAGVR